MMLRRYAGWITLAFFALLAGLSIRHALGQAYTISPPTDSAGRAPGLGTTTKVTYRGGIAWSQGSGASGLSLAGIYHLSSSTKRVEVQRIAVTLPPQTTVPAGWGSVVVRRITGLTGTTNSAALSGTNKPLAHDTSQADAEATLVACAAFCTSSIAYTGGTVVTQSSMLYWGAQNQLSYEWKMGDAERPMALRAATAEALDFQFNFSGNSTGTVLGIVEIDFTEE
jgi:hypothetical protein